MLAQELNLEMLCNQSVYVIHVFGAEDMKLLSMADIEKKIQPFSFQSLYHFYTHFS